MASGYTQSILDGANFKTFALECARAFGALITMRDDPHGTPIPDEIVPSTDYYDKSLVQDKQALRELKKMKPDQWNIKADEHNRQQRKYWEKRRLECAEIRAKYEAILAQVKKWKPPTKDHKEIKKFMIDQITKSIDWDCSDKRDKKPTPIDGETWYNNQMESVLHSLQYHKKERAAEIKRAKERTKWIRAYKQSILEMPD